VFQTVTERFANNLNNFVLEKSVIKVDRLGESAHSNTRAECVSVPPPPPPPPPPLPLLPLLWNWHDNMGWHGMVGWMDGCSGIVLYFIDSFVVHVVFCLPTINVRRHGPRDP
jgi:hypothetical protein